ncbi:MAG: hypothetical protein INR63_26305 [Actinomycetospora chiangmaiensis]|nr:hypothetical protein [Actinomycetospora chiangmaiensis]
MPRSGKTGPEPPSWLAMGTDLTMLGIEAQMIGQRVAMPMVGRPKARVEARVRVTETVLAAGNAVVTLAVGGTPRKGVRGYRTKVRANRRRLSQG